MFSDNVCGLNPIFYPIKNQGFLPTYLDLSSDLSLIQSTQIDNNWMNPVNPCKIDKASPFQENQFPFCYSEKGSIFYHPPHVFTHELVLFCAASSHQRIVEGPV